MHICLSAKKRTMARGISVLKKINTIQPVASHSLDLAEANKSIPSMTISQNELVRTLDIVRQLSPECHAMLLATLQRDSRNLTTLTNYDDVLRVETLCMRPRSPTHSCGGGSERGAPQSQNDSVEEHDEVILLGLMSFSPCTIS